MQVMKNKQTSEIQVVRQLIAALVGQPIVFTLDALHCQKKRSS
jgi:predicted transposase YbfD/YdcC